MKRSQPHRQIRLRRRKIHRHRQNQTMTTTATLLYMAKSKTGGSKAFGGKKAAPFVKGGGRAKASANDAKGKPRKR